MSKSGLTLVLHISYLSAFMKDTLDEPQDTQEAAEPRTSSPAKRKEGGVVAIGGRTGGALDAVYLEFKDTLFKKYGGLGGEPIVPHQLAPEEWIVQVQQIPDVTHYLGDGMIFTLNTGRTIRLEGDWGKCKGAEQLNTQSFRVSDNETQHVIGLIFGSGSSHEPTSKLIGIESAVKPDNLSQNRVQLGWPSGVVWDNDEANAEKVGVYKRSRQKAAAEAQVHPRSYRVWTRMCMCLLWHNIFNNSQ